MHVRQVVPRDAIPSVDDPQFDTDYDGDPGDRVLVVDAPAGARAYPIRYLDYHEIVNDEVDGDPIAITWCPLCGSGIVYERVVDGRTLTFGVSGKLADDDLVMYDHETESEWKQSSGECIVGPFKGESFAVRPGSVLRWRQFRESHPDGVVLQSPGGESEAASDGDTPAAIDYDESPYADYFEAEGFGLAAHRGDGSREWDRDDDIDPKTVVLGIEAGGEAVGFPLPRVLSVGGIARATVGGRSVVVFADEDAGIHGYVDPGYDFGWTDDGLAADGTTWEPATGRSADGRRLERLPTRRLFAFAWQDDHDSGAFWDESA